MRIIDKNTDFYDYWQGIYHDNSVTFDRTDSFLLTKELMCERLNFARFRAGYGDIKCTPPYCFLLLQVCHTFWLFLLKIIKENDYGRPLDYEMQLLVTWKNYNAKRRLVRMDFIDFYWGVTKMFCRDKRRGSYEKITQMTDVFVKAIDTNDFRVVDSVDRHMIYKGDGTKEEKHIPLLKACGVAGCIDPLAVYLAFEEFFSLEKTSSERTASIGITDEEKIGNHGFDTKTSFRGK